LGGNISEVVNIKVDANGYVDLIAVSSSINSQMQFSVTTSKGNFDVVDYASAGTTWDAVSEFRTWLPTK